MDYDEKTGTWEVKVERGGWTGAAYGKRVLKPRRVVFALGLASNQGPCVLFAEDKYSEPETRRKHTSCAIC